MTRLSSLTVGAVQNEVLEALLADTRAAIAVNDVADRLLRLSDIVSQLRRLKVNAYASVARAAVDQVEREKESAAGSEESQREQEREADQAADDLRLCSDLTHSGDILAEFAKDLRALGVAGEERNAKLIYLALVSRLFERLVNIGVKGPSAAGKSFLVEKVVGFFPAGTCYTLTSMSERALIYSTEPLVHRHLVVYEWAGLSSEFGSYLVRSLLSEGRVAYDTVEKSADGSMVARRIEKEGPSGLITTTTAADIHPENETRMLTVTVRDDPEQTRAVMLAEAAAARHHGGAKQDVDLSRWHALQRILARGPSEVEVPFARTLAEKIPPVATRLRRDFPMLLTLVRAHALLHRESRANVGGRVVAEILDYAAVRELVADAFGTAAGASVQRIVRETVDVVAKQNGMEVTVTGLARLLDIEKGAVSRRVKLAISKGFLQNLETGRGRPARLVLSDPMPDDRELLPDSKVLETAEVADAEEFEGFEHPLEHPEANNGVETGRVFHDSNGNSGVALPATEAQEGYGAGYPLSELEHWNTPVESEEGRRANCSKGDWNSPSTPNTQPRDEHIGADDDSLAALIKKALSDGVLRRPEEPAQ